MRNTKQVNVDNTPVVISSYHELWLCHDGSGTTLSNSSTNSILGDITVNGTTAGIWANAGNFTPAGDHTRQANNAFQVALGDLSSAAGGVAQMIFFVDFNATTNPAAGYETFLMYGNTSGANLMRFTLETNGRCQVQTRDSSDVIVSTSSGTAGDVCDGERHSMVALIDFVNGSQDLYVDGTLDSSQTLDAESPVASQSRGFGILANITSDTPSFNRQLGSGPSSVFINRMGLIRPSTDISASIGDIARGLYEVQHELPRALHGI